MKIKLEVPSNDFIKLINALHEQINKEGFSFFNFKARNQIIEEGGYSFQFQVEKGYSHDDNKMSECGKVVINIDTIPPQ